MMAVEFHKSTMFKGTIDQLAKSGMIEHGELFLALADKEGLFGSTSDEAQIKSDNSQKGVE